MTGTWIDVAEEKPTDEGDVLCCDATSHNDIWVGRRDTEGNWQLDEWTRRTPTHWMELPEMPEHRP